MTAPLGIEPLVVRAVLVGKVGPLGRAQSGIDKRPVDGEVRVTRLGLAGDEQGDLKAHGGPDKAIHHYAFDHYPRWREELGALPVFAQEGAFGENLSTLGLTESQVCLGDRFALGGAVIEVSQARQPCWKLAARTGVWGMAKLLQDTGRTGWYYRVLEEGPLRAGDALTLLERPWPEWPLARLVTLLFDKTLDRDELRAALELPLVPSRRELYTRRLERGVREDWRKRLEGAEDV